MNAARDALAAALPTDPDDWTVVLAFNDEHGFTVPEWGPPETGADQLLARLAAAGYTITDAGVPAALANEQDYATSLRSDLTNLEEVVHTLHNLRATFIRKAARTRIEALEANSVLCPILTAKADAYNAVADSLFILLAPTSADGKWIRRAAPSEPPSELERDGDAPMEVGGS